MNSSIKRPTNVIWIFGDQHRAQAQGYKGDPNLSTPNLDRLAAQGLQFEKALINSPLCCPARGSLLTGKYPQHAVRAHDERLDPTIPTIAHAFKEHGYHTSWFGKWHVDGKSDAGIRAGKKHVSRERRGGFDTWIGYENNNSPFDCWVHGHRDAEDVPLQRLPGYETDALSDHFIDHLEKMASQEETQPFFASLSVQPPHDPYTPPERWMKGKSAGKIQFRPNVPDIPRIREKASRDLVGYYGAIENLDWNVGRIVDALERLGLYENTHIIFFSDHGDMHGSHGQFLKTTPYEEAIRIPLIVTGIDPSPYGALRCGETNALCTNVDLGPTSLGLCGLPVPEGMMGRDLSAIRLQTQQEPVLPDSAYIQIVTPTCHPDSVDRAWRGVVSDDGWKYVCLEGGHPWLLFNLNEDPYEQANLALNTHFASQRQKLHQRLCEWVAETEDTFDMSESPQLSQYLSN